jgi:hypothetical protein
MFQHFNGFNDPTTQHPGEASRPVAATLSHNPGLISASLVVGYSPRTSLMHRNNARQQLNHPRFISLQGTVSTDFCG